MLNGLTALEWLPPLEARGRRPKAVPCTALHLHAQHGATLILITALLYSLHASRRVDSSFTGRPGLGISHVYRTALTSETLALQPRIIEPARVDLASQLRTGAMLAAKVQCRARASDPNERPENDADKDARVKTTRIHG
eukprot:scaffold86413_cov45-Phaeocystis_antarctica.AAC.1